jgi:hypothetical protein
MGTKSERLSVLSDIEQYALYGLPDFDEGQRSEFLSQCSQGDIKKGMASSKPLASRAQSEE